MIKVDKNLCKGCGICIEFCPVMALEFLEEVDEEGIRHPICIPEKCNNCGICILMCPDFAMEEVE